jgi:hypothetical protein
MATNQKGAVKMKWSTLIESKREELELAIRKQYAEAINGNTWLNYVVLLHDDGEVDKSHRTQNSSSMAEYNGEAICIYSEQGFDHDFDTNQEVANDNEIQPILVEKYNELYPNENIDHWKEINDLHGFIYDNLPEWLNDVANACAEYEVSEFDPSEIIGRKIKEEKSCELYQDE